MLLEMNFEDLAVQENQQILYLFLCVREVNNDCFT